MLSVLAKMYNLLSKYESCAKTDHSSIFKYMALLLTFNFSLTTYQNPTVLMIWINFITTHPKKDTLIFINKTKKHSLRVCGVASNPYFKGDYNAVLTWSLGRSELH